MLTIDRASLSSNAMLNYFIKYSDLVLEVKSFSDTPDKFLNYQGTIQLLKQPVINGLLGHRAQHDIYVFKSEKKLFKVDVIHMDPEDPGSKKEKPAEETKAKNDKRKCVDLPNPYSPDIMC